MSLLERMKMHVAERLHPELSNLERAQSQLSGGDHNADEALRIAAEAIDDAIAGLKAVLA